MKSYEYSLFSLNRHSSDSDLKIFIENYAKFLKNIYNKEINQYQVTENPNIFLYDFRLKEQEENISAPLVLNEGDPNKLTNSVFYNFLYNNIFFQYSEDGSLTPSNNLNRKLKITFTFELDLPHPPLA